jgi:hypothetical protein
VVYLISTAPCIVIYSYSTTNKMHLLSQIIYSCKTLCMFRTVFPSIIRSSKLRIQQRYMSKSCCYLLLSGMRWNCTCYLKLFILVKRSACFGGLSVHHQELKTAYTATVYVKQLLLSGMRWNCTCYLKLFILVKRSTCFGRCFRPSSGAQNCVNSNMYTRVCQTAAAICCSR